MTAYIVDAVRTPVGRIGGALAAVRPDDLAAGVLEALVGRRAVPPELIDDVVFGNGNGAGEENRNVARMATLLAGLGTAVPGTTVNRLCGSGLEAVVQASRAVEVGDAAVVVAGGVESMSRAPWVVPKPASGYPRDHQTMYSTTLGWRMVNPRHNPDHTISLGEGAEVVADLYGVGREEQDVFALRSHRLAAAAWERGAFAAEVVPPFGATLERDESVRTDSSLERLAGLSPVFKHDGTVTAGNASPMNDGASALLLASEAGLEALGAEPLARVAARGVSAVVPQQFGIGPVEAANVALARAGIGWDDLAAVELNEAFAAQALACLSAWPDCDPDIVNPLGGAIAIGHPIGASGARILTTLVHHLTATGGRWGLAAMCIGVGQGIAVVVERQ